MITNIDYHETINVNTKLVGKCCFSHLLKDSVATFLSTATELKPPPNEKLGENIVFILGNTTAFSCIYTFKCFKVF